MPCNEEIIFGGSLAIVLFLMWRLLRELEPERAQRLVGTAFLIFVFRAMPHARCRLHLVDDRRAGLRSAVPLRACFDLQRA